MTYQVADVRRAKGWREEAAEDAYYRSAKLGPYSRVSATDESTSDARQE